ncbi:hypothetical protein [Nocardia sp. NPDC058633]|uniref:hypothetical protein n=1 Tax=Nocardia sp. NPDC058633 TaxID=3346568 RepID=UPI00364B1D76
MSPLAHVVQAAILSGITLGLAVVGIGTAVADYRRKRAAALVVPVDEQPVTYWRGAA